MRIFSTALLGMFLIAGPALAQLQPYVPYSPYPGAPNYSYSQPTDPRTAAIIYWYQQFLGRDPEPNGVAGWISQINGGATMQFVEAGILGSQEFYTKAGSTPQAFVNAAYQKLTGRMPSRRDLYYWSRRVTSEPLVNVAGEMIQVLRPAPWAR
jgi:hypothetical protein